MQIQSDEELLLDFILKNENDSLALLFNRYAHLVFGVCMRYLGNEEDCKDASMQIFEFLLLNIKKYQISNFKSWLYSVTKNHCLMELRKRKVKKKILGIETEKKYLEIMESVSNFHLFNQEELPIDEDFLLKSLGELDPAQRKCLELMYLQDKSYKEISELTGYTFNQVKSFIQNGKRNLKLMLVKNGKGI